MCSSDLNFWELSALGIAGRTMKFCPTRTRPIEATLRVAQGLSGAENRSLTFPKSTTNLARQDLPMGSGIEVTSVPGLWVQPAAVGDAPLPLWVVCRLSLARGLSFLAH